MNERVKSKAMYERLCEVIPGGVNSPVRAASGMRLMPLVIDSASGDTVIDVDGNAYIDYCCSWGALIHGHAHPGILSAVQKRMAKGTSFGITSSIEEAMARIVVDLVDSIEQIRFVSSGTEATMSAVRLARGYTGRDTIVKFAGCYHGHADFFLIQAGSAVMGLTPTSSSAGVPNDIVKHSVSLPYNDIQACQAYFQEHGHSVAAVIVEPVAGNMGVVPATAEFLTTLRQLTQANGALLIFDEVISGFRLGLAGAQGLYGIEPDLTCLGKIVGGGFPAAAFGGKKKIMQSLAPIGKVFQAGTLSGNPIAMEAGYQTIKLLQAEGAYEELTRKAEVITDPVREFIEEHKIKACIQQQGSMFTLFFGQREVRNSQDAKCLDTELFAEFYRYMFANGVYVPPAQQEAWFVSTAHQESNLCFTRDLILDFLAQISGAGEEKKFCAGSSCRCK